MTKEEPTSKEENFDEERKDTEEIFEKEIHEEEEESDEDETLEDLLPEELPEDNRALNRFLMNPWKNVAFESDGMIPITNLETDLPQESFSKQDDENEFIDYFSKDENDETEYRKPELSLGIDNLYKTGMNESEDTIIEEQKKLQEQRGLQNQAFSKSFEMNQAMKNGQKDLYVKADLMKDSSLRKDTISKINEGYKVR
jgi:hypothetical protein